jgi:hypothetical protein
MLKRVFVHRNRWNEFDVEQGRIQINPEGS